MTRAASQRIRLLVEEDLALPVVDFEFAFRVGAIFDPTGQEGLALATGRLVKEGPAGISAHGFEDQLAQLGARLGVDTSAQAVRFRVTTLQRNMESVFALVAQTLQNPAFRRSDLQRIKREINNERIQALDDDQLLVAGFFRAFLFEGHPYGRSVVGDRRSLKKIDLPQVKRFFNKHYRSTSLIVGAAGASQFTQVRKLSQENFGRVKVRAQPSIEVPASTMRAGRRILIVDKPDRTQCQLYIGRIGIKTRDPQFFPLLVANTAFGGSFSSRLMQAIRVERGWSYGAYSRLYHSEQRDSWHMWTFPAQKDLRACIELEIALMEQWYEKGITQKELKFAKSSLINSRCFDEETAIKRLSTRLEVALGGIPSSYIDDYDANVRSVSLKQANAAIQSRLDPKDLAIVVVASAKAVEPELRKIAGISSVEVVAHDRF